MDDDDDDNNNNNNNNNNNITLGAEGYKQVLQLSQS
jgi:hypothetical protein